MLVEDLPRPDDIVETESMVVVRKFSAFEEWDTGLLGPDAARQLRDATPFTDHGAWHETEKLTEQEFAIARVLADGRPGLLRADRRGRRRERVDRGPAGRVAGHQGLPAVPHPVRDAGASAWTSTSCSG